MPQNDRTADATASLAILLGTVASLLVFGPGPVPLFRMAEWSADAQGVPFALTSAQSGFSVVGRYEGSLSLTEEGLVVRLDEGRIDVRPGNAGDDRLEGIRVGLARKTGGSWTTGASSSIHYLGGRPVVEMDGHTMEGIELLIPGVGADDLEGRWLVVSHMLTAVPEEPGGYAGPAWTYVHSDPALLALLAAFQGS